MIAPRPPLRRHRGLRRWPYGLIEATTDVNGTPVRALTSGSLRKSTEAVFLPGLGAPGYLAPWARETATWTRVTLLDLPGWRAGSARSCAPSLPAVARMTADWLEATGRDRVVLVGHSTGAQSVLRTALQVPHRVAAVVLAGPTFDPPARTVSALLGRIGETIVHERPAEALAVGPSYLRSGVLPLLRFVRSALPDRPEDLVPRLTMPVLVLTGQRDGLAPPAWAERLAHLARATCVVIPGAHNAPFTAPQIADAALHEFALSRGWTQRDVPQPRLSISTADQ
jgi:pimeloyl-ACP methyl ester carboxylesterase